METRTEIRLRRLERQNRLLLGLIGGAAALFVLVGAGRSSVVTAERFVLTDAAGKEVGALETFEGRPRLILGTNPSNHAVFLSEEADSTTLVLHSPGSSHASLTTHDAFSGLSLDGQVGGARGYANFNGGPRPTQVMESASKWHCYLEPSPTNFLYLHDGTKMRAWWTPSELQLNGQTIKLNDANGALIQQLPITIRHTGPNVE